jgi:hypothetical protein
VWRDDLELARVVLAADPDLTMRDTGFQSTPMGWAQHLQRREMVTLLERHLEKATG